jgi:hypothetical protein
MVRETPDTPDSSSGWVHLGEATYDSGEGGHRRARILKGRDIGGPEQLGAKTPKASNVNSPG